MIYKFKFEIWEDDNQTLVRADAEESGDLMLVWTAFFNRIMGYLQVKNLW